MKDALPTELLCCGHNQVNENVKLSFHRGTIHSEGLNYAKKIEQVKMSTCSEVIHADVEELEFETPTALADLTVSAANVEVVSCEQTPALFVSTASALKVHKLEKVEVKVR